jgi:hypothetical protein
VPILLGAVLSVLGALVITTSSGPAVADSRHDLGIGDFSHLLVDEAHGHLFLSQGYGQDEVVVTDLTGAPVTRLTGLSGATDMVLSHDGATVYIGLASADAIAAYDAATLDKVAVYPTGRNSCPASLAAVGTMVAFDAVCENTTASGLGILDPADGSVDFKESFQSAELYSSAAQPDTVYRLSSSWDGSVLGKLVLTTVESTHQLEEVDSVDIDRAYFVAGSVDGSLLVTEQGQVVDTADMTLATSVPVSGTPDNRSSVGVGFNADGVIGVTERRYDAPDLFLHQPTTPGDAGAPSYTRLRTYELDGAADSAKQHLAEHGGLAFGARDAYVVTGRFVDNQPDFRLQVVTPRAGDAALTVDVPDKSYATGSRVPVSARLTLPGGASAAGREISFEVRPIGSSFRVAATATTGADGRATTRLKVNHNTVVRARYVDVATTTDVDASARISVAATVTASVTGSTQRRGKYVVLPVSGRATLRAFSSNSSSCLRFEVERNRGGSWTPETRFACTVPNPPLGGPKGVTKYVAGRKYGGQLLRARASTRDTEFVDSGTSNWVYFTFAR